MLDIQKVLDYWFEGLNNSSELGMNVKTCMKWHSKAPEVDEEIRTLFHDDYENYSKGFNEELTSGKEFLAYILLCD